MVRFSASDEKKMASAIRFLAADAVEAANSGHPGMPLGMADVATVLFRHFLTFDPPTPDWPNRDRFILSAGHGSMLLYAALYLCGYKHFTLDVLRRFRQWESPAAGHPEYIPASGIETTTGPLGQGLANAVGMALAERMANARFGDALINHHVYAIVGDGCLMEGISHEALGLAGHLRLSRLIVLFDDNGISIDGPVSLTCSENQLMRFEAAGWKTLAIDGHDPQAIYDALALAQTHDCPTFIACKTTIGFGAPSKQGSAETHGKALGGDEIEAMRKALDWPHPAFEIPAAILEGWRQSANRHEKTHARWKEALGKLPEAEKREWQAFEGREMVEKAGEIIAPLCREWRKSTPALASRQSSQKVLEVLAPAMPHLIGGSADLTGSNNTKTASTRPIMAGDYAGQYIYYGIREHAMAAAMNGVALYGGFIPYGGTFLVFSDYCRPAIRLSALMQQPVIYVMTHDSIALGEDGPTHQPVEHLASLRVIPGVRVFRPADAVETAECWQMALEYKKGPSILVLSRQTLPGLARQEDDANSFAGAWLAHKPEKKRDLTILASGAEVAPSIEAAKQLEDKNINVAVLSFPCREIFDSRPEKEKKALLGEAPRLVVEAAHPAGWDRYLNEARQDRANFLCMDSFGASAPGDFLLEKFGFSPDNIAQRICLLLDKPA